MQPKTIGLLAIATLNLLGLYPIKSLLAQTQDAIIAEGLNQSQPASATSHPLPNLPTANPVQLSPSFFKHFAPQTQLIGHQSSVNSASYSEDGKLIVTASSDGTARVWDNSGKLKSELKGQKGSVYSANFSSDGQRIITASVDGTARIWDLSGKELAIFEGHSGKVYSASFSADGKRIVTASDDKTARVWDTSGKLLAELKGHNGSVYSASFSSDGQRIVTASADKTARIWESSGKLLTEIKGHTDTIWSANFSRDGKHIVTASDDKTARIWDSSGKLLSELTGHSDSVKSANFSFDGQQVITASDDKTAIIWNLKGEQLAILERNEGSVNSASFSSDGQHIVTASSDNTASVWNLSRWMSAELRHLERVNSASFSPDGQRIVTASNDRTAKVWNANGQLLTELRHLDQVNSASFSPDGQRIVTASLDGTARVWNANGQLLTELRHQDSVMSASFSPDGQRIVTASLDGTAKVWNLSGKLLAELLPNNIDYSPKAQADRLRDLQFYAPNWERALAPWQQALKLYQELKDRENEAIVLQKLGNAYSALGNYIQAINSYSQSLTIARELNNSESAAQSLSSLGDIYNTLADYPKAIEDYNQALNILKDQDNSTSKASALVGLGNANYYQGKYADTARYYSQAFTIHTQQLNSDAVAKDKLYLGNAYNALGDTNKALQYYKEALESFKSQLNLLGQGEALGGLGNTYLALGDSTKAIQYLQEWVNIARQKQDKPSLGNALNSLANAYRVSGNLSAAESTLNEAIKVWESIREKLDDAQKISIFEKQSLSYRWLQEVLIAQNKKESALAVAERGRARAFVELLSRRLSANPTEQLAITPPNIDEIKQIAKKQNATLVEYSIILDNSKIDNKEKSQESQLYIWVIKPTGEIRFRAVDLKPLWQQQNTSLSDLVADVRCFDNVNCLNTTQIAQRGFNLNAQTQQAKPTSTPQSRNKQLRQLHQLLIQPIADLLPSNPDEHVIFIPQKELFLVPFPALIDTNNQYLIEKHTILTAPSIQTLDLTYQKRQRIGQLGLQNSVVVGIPRGNAVVVGNPTMPSISPAPGEDARQLASLPGAEEEAKDVAPLINTQALIGGKATKAAVVSQMPNAKIIHLATHGLLDEYRGLGSAIALAPTATDNGLLTAEDILKLKLNAELVVLSACNTGRGRITGDGVIGLSRSFISAGVPSIIVSLWSIPDAPTAFLMSEFYKNWQQDPNKDKAKALRQAMLATMKQRPEPENWAAFTLIGEAE